MERENFSEYTSLVDMLSGFGLVLLDVLRLVPWPIWIIAGLFVLAFSLAIWGDLPEWWRRKKKRSLNIVAEEFATAETNDGINLAVPSGTVTSGKDLQQIRKNAKIAAVWRGVSLAFWSAVSVALLIFAGSVGAYLLGREPRQFAWWPQFDELVRQTGDLVSDLYGVLHAVLYALPYKHLAGFELLSAEVGGLTWLEVISSIFAFGMEVSIVCVLTWFLFFRSAQAARGKQMEQKKSSVSEPKPKMSDELLNTSRLERKKTRLAALAKGRKAQVKELAAAKEAAEAQVAELREQNAAKLAGVQKQMEQMLDSHLAKERLLQEEYDKQLAEARSEHADALREMQSKHAEELETARQESIQVVTELEKALAKVREDNAKNANKLLKKTEECKQEKERADHTESMVEQLNTQIETVSSMLAKHKEELEEKDAQIFQLEEELKKKIARIVELITHSEEKQSAATAELPEPEEDLAEELTIAPGLSSEDEETEEADSPEEAASVDEDFWEKCARLLGECSQAKSKKAKKNANDRLGKNLTDYGLDKVVSQLELLRKSDAERHAEVCEQFKEFTSANFRSRHVRFRKHISDYSKPKSEKS